MVAITSSRRSFSSENKTIIESYIVNKKTHVLSFHCARDDPTMKSGEHAIYDEYGMKRYEISLYRNVDGTKKHSLVNENGQKLGLLSVKSPYTLNFEVTTPFGTKVNGTYNPHIYRHSKATININGTIYSIIKSKLDGKKIFYWVSTETKEPLVAMTKGFKAHSFTFYPNCPEIFKRAILLVRSHACDIS